jgi:hypothetical protein
MGHGGVNRRAAARAPARGGGPRQAARRAPARGADYLPTMSMPVMKW